MFKTTPIIVMAVLCLNFNSRAQSQKTLPLPEKQAILGKVVSATTGEALPGAVIKIITPNHTTISNDKGEFILTLSNGTYNISISHLSYKNKNISLQIPLKKQLIITLDTDDKNLHEVEINAGYYTVKEQERTGSISKINAETIAKQPISNPLQALQGRVAGMEITQNTGVPGGGFTVRIRGQNSITSGNEPLYIIDGVPFISSSLSSSLLAGNITNQASPLSSISPSDIESIEVLKDADATAIYGSRGANGVVLITTKKGKPGKTKLDFNLNQGIGQVGSRIDLLNTEQYLEMRMEAFANDGVSPAARDYDVNGTWDKTQYTDWQEVLIGGTANYTNLAGSISGGSESTQFLLGSSYNRESTIFPGDMAYRRGAININMIHQSTNQKFKLKLSSIYGAEQNNIFKTDLTSLITAAPNAPSMYDAEGNINWANGTYNNPAGYLLKLYKANTSNLNSNLNLSYQLTADLEVKSSFGFSRLNRREIQTNPLSSFSPANGFKAENTTSYFVDNGINTWIAEPQVVWQKKYNVHQLNLLAGVTFQRNHKMGQSLLATGFNSESLMENLSAAASITSPAGINSIYSYAAVFGRFFYSYLNKYMVNLTGRRDGSSRFGPNNRFSNFAAIGTAWIFGHEQLIQNSIPFLSYGKLRGSFGITGNDQVGEYEYLNLWSTTDYPYQGIAGTFPERLYNPNYEWEKNRKVEAAIELGFLKDKLLLTVNYYNNRSSNQLIRYALPTSVGFNYVLNNLPAVIANTGWEFELNTRNINSANFQWSTGFNLSVPKNKLIRFPGLAESSYAIDLVVGHPLSILRSLRSMGVDPQTGLYTFADLNNDGKISSPDDRLDVKFIGKQYYGGLQNVLKYRGFELDFLVQFVKQTGKNYMVNTLVPGYYNINQPVDVLTRWKVTNDQSDIQRFTQKTSSEFTNARNFGYAVSDASFLRIKNVYLSYRFHDNWLKSVGIQSARLYLQGQNLLTITKFIGLDPEAQDYRTTPPLRMLSAGIQLTF